MSVVRTFLFARIFIRKFKASENWRGPWQALYRLLFVISLSLTFTLFLHGTSVLGDKGEKPEKDVVETAQPERVVQPSAIPQGTNPAPLPSKQDPGVLSQPGKEWNLSPNDTVISSLFGSAMIVDTAKFMTMLMRGFPVTSNALGDMNEDSVVNIWDLIRSRNIWQGIGNPPSSYDLTEGDLTRDGTIDLADVSLLRGVFVGQAGLPQCNILGVSLRATKSPFQYHRMPWIHKLS